MKKRLLTAVTAAVLLAGCGKVSAESTEKTDQKAADMTEQVQETVTEQAETDPAEDSSSEAKPDEASHDEAKPDEDKSFVSIDLTTSEKKGVKGVGVYGYYEYGSLCDLFGRHVLHSEVVGLFGAPVEFSCNDFQSAKIQFNVDRDNMGGVPLKNLVMLHYNEENGSYDQVRTFTDGVDYRVTAEITEPGVYLLVDGYQWYSCWGADVSGFEKTTNTDFSPFEDRSTVNGNYHDSSLGFSMQLPAVAKQIDHTECYSCDDFSLATFSRICPEYSATDQLWIDISILEPSKEMTLEEFRDVFMKSRTGIYGDYQYATVRTMKSAEPIVSADGTAGLRFISEDRYYCGDELGDPEESWYDVYPIAGGFIEFHAEYLHIDGSDSIGVRRELAAETLGTVRFDK